VALVRQDLEREKSITIGLRTRERSAAYLWPQLPAEAQVTARREAAAGKQFWVDFCELRRFSHLKPATPQNEAVSQGLRQHHEGAVSPLGTLRTPRGQAVYGNVWLG
jgi:hypothetical protein